MVCVERCLCCRTYRCYDPFLLNSCTCYCVYRALLRSHAVPDKVPQADTAHRRAPYPIATLARTASEHTTRALRGAQARGPFGRSAQSQSCRHRYDCAVKRHRDSHLPPCAHQVALHARHPHHHHARRTRAREGGHGGCMYVERTRGGHTEPQTEPHTSTSGPLYEHPRTSP